MKADEPVKILLVDDRPENLLALEVMLANRNHELIKASSGKEALKILLREHDFALILMDALMPIMDGFETADLIRQSERLKYIPIIFLTAQMNAPDNIFKGYQSGAVDYMLKPLSAEILKAKVAVFVDLYRKNKELIVQIEEKNKAETAALIAEEAAKSKQQFLSNMSHEIRTPMNAIIGFTKVILKTDLNEKQREYVNAIKVSGDSLIVLINDILDLAKVDAGKMTFEQIPFKLSAPVDDMMMLVENKIQENNLELVKDFDSSIPEIVLGDPVRLKQIILNLLSNAIKFTEAGKITVSAHLVNEDADYAAVEFSVADTGIGIPENKIGAIFENFQQATSKTTRLFGGTGLGLSIVKHLVEAQQGTLSIKSKLGEGSTFSFTMKFKKTTEKLHRETDNGISLDDGIKDVKILVAEDVKMNQLLMRTILEEFGFKIDLADNGQVALDKVGKNEYDIVLMDVQMPEMDGIEATKHIRSDLNSHVPIIALTADVTTVDVEKCRNVGMNDYLSKPVDEKLLYNMIAKYVKANRMPHNGNGFHKQAATRENEQRCTNLDFLKQKAKRNPETIMEFIKVFLEENPLLISKMKQSIDKRDWESLAKEAHALKPTFSMMGISKEYTEMAQKIQNYASNREKPDIISELFLKIDTICAQARKELEEELGSLEHSVK